MENYNNTEEKFQQATLKVQRADFFGCKYYVSSVHG